MLTRGFTITCLFFLAVGACLADEVTEQPAVTLKDAKSLEYDLDYRIWRDKSGKFSVMAKFVKLEDGVVHLRRKDNKKTVRIEIDTLSNGDQRLAKEIEEFNSRQQEIKLREERIGDYVLGVKSIIQTLDDHDMQLEIIESDESLTKDFLDSQKAKLNNEFKNAVVGLEVNWYFHVDDFFGGEDLKVVATCACDGYPFF